MYLERETPCGRPPSARAHPAGSLVVPPLACALAGHPAARAHEGLGGTPRAAQTGGHTASTQGQRETPQRGTQGGGAESLPARARSPSPRRLTAPRGDGRRGSVGREPEATCAKQARPPVPGHRDAAPRRAPGRRRVIKVAPTPSRWRPCRPAGAHGPSHSPDLTDPASFPVISQTENRLPS